MKCSECGRPILVDQLRCEACGHDMLPEDIARHLPEVPTTATLESESLGVVLKEKERQGIPVSRDAARLVLASEAIARARLRWLSLLAAAAAGRPVPEVPTTAVLESRQDAARLALASEAMRRARWRVFPILAALIVLATLFLLAGL